jgi:GxxExxY protein
MPASAYIKPEYPLSEITARIIAAAARVHSGLGPGFEEVVYQRALALELRAEGLDYQREVDIEVTYRGERVGRKRVDFEIEGVMVEIKAQSQLEPAHFVQALSYLKASGWKVGLLLNFGAEKLQIKRLVN